MVKNPRSESLAVVEGGLGLSRDKPLARPLSLAELGVALQQTHSGVIQRAVGAWSYRRSWRVEGVAVELQRSLRVESRQRNEVFSAGVREWPSMSEVPRRDIRCIRWQMPRMPCRGTMRGEQSENRHSRLVCCSVGKLSVFLFILNLLCTAGS